MTKPHTSDIPGTLPGGSTGRSVARVAGPLIASVVVLLFALPMAWMLAYFMNDEVQTGDHVVFLGVPIVELAVTGLVAGLVIGRSADLGYARALGGALALVFVPLLVVAAGYALLSLTPLFDDAIGSSGSNGVWLGVAAATAVSAVLLSVLGARLLRPRP
ncbi:MULTISPECIES: hypothetical protein [Mumia]|uniref:hypothetical protein n=1 Tax=Mumia TaxID=1546255 RepID=UPI0014242B78|nr:hypothetical protein [Mumia sp. ZJ1417]QMW67235.1 hypothetical protein H4N58_04765 [Mumia sp. ZJ1417]